MADRIIQLKDQEDNNVYPVPPFGFPIPIPAGGTGADNAEDARENIGLGTMAVVDSPVPIENGGTGKATAPEAFTALSGYTLDLGTNNASDTWVPVLNGTKVQHLVLADYVLEQGSGGIFRYQKWKSGKAECWGSTTFTDTCNKAWGGLYESASGHYWSYPSGLFAANPSVFCTMHGTSQSAAFVEVSTDGSASRTPNFYPIRPTSAGSQSWTAHVYAVGRWK